MSRYLNANLGVLLFLERQGWWLRNEIKVLPIKGTRINRKLWCVDTTYLGNSNLSISNDLDANWTCILGNVPPPASPEPSWAPVPVPAVPPPDSDEAGSDEAAPAPAASSKRGQRGPNFDRPRKMRPKRSSTSKGKPTSNGKPGLVSQARKRSRTNTEDSSATTEDNSATTEDNRANDGDTNIGLCKQPLIVAYSWIQSRKIAEVSDLADEAIRRVNAIDDPPTPGTAQAMDTHLRVTCLHHVLHDDAHDTLTHSTTCIHDALHDVPHDMYARRTPRRCPRHTHTLDDTPSRCTPRCPPRHVCTT